MKKLFLIDAYALIFKCYYAFLGRPMRNRDGVNTSAVFGFVKFLRDIFKREKPQYLGVAFDPKGGCFRKEIYPAYKANRPDTPEDIVASVPYIKRVLEAMRIPVLEVAGYEADDVIGTLSHKAAAEGFEVYMVTPDKDYGQLVTDRIFIYRQKKGSEGIDILGPRQINEHYGIASPQLVIDILSLWGDASDNIPGVPGIGEKGACKLVGQLGTVENILARTDLLRGRQKENIEANRDQLLMAKRLATISLDVPIEFDPQSLAVEPPDTEQLREVYSELGFNMFLREMESEKFSPFNSSVTVDTPTVADGDIPVQAAQTQLAQVAAAKSRQRAAAALRGQGSLFDDPALQAPGSSANAAPDAASEPPQESAFASAAETPHDYRTARTEEQVREMVARLRSCDRICLDTETTGFDIFNDRLVGISFAVEPGQAWYVPLDAASLERYRPLLAPLLADPAVAKIGQNIKFDIMVLRANGLEVRGFKYDTMLLHYLLDPESRHGMNQLALRYLDYRPIEITSLIGTGSKQLTMDMVPVDKVAEYAAEDADVTLRLMEVLWPMVEEQGLAELYRTIEEPMIDVLAGIEMTGVKIDVAALDAYGEVLTGELVALEERIRRIAGDQTLNINSARQLGELLFTRLRIDDKPKMTKTRQFRTDEEYLQSLAPRHEIIGLILEYRGIKKLLSTYVEALPQLVNRTTGRIHTSFNQAVTATGRLSSTNPNLQNIPVRDERGRHIRRAFVASDDDHLLLSVDYSQVELRLMAHLSGDPHLIEAFQCGEDIHAATAARLFGIPFAEVTADQRRKAKTANFGIIYGISAFGLSQRLNIPRTEAKSIIDGYFASYPGVKEYMDRVVAKAKEEGYVSTLFGRRRYLNDIASRNAVARGLAERNAINAPIQGSAADIMKIAMIEVDRRLREGKFAARVILQVHDEIVLDVPRDELDAVRTLVVEAMESAAALRVKLVADAGWGANWVEAH